MLGPGPRRTPVIPMVVLAPVALVIFDAVRVVVTLTARHTFLQVVVASVVVAAAGLSLPLVERAGRGVVVALVSAMVLARLVLQVLPPEPSVAGQAVPAAVIIGLAPSLLAAYSTVYGGRVMGLGLLVGAVFDLAVLAGLSTLPLAWWQGLGPVAWIAVTGIGTVAALGIDRRLTMPHRPPARVPAVAVAATGAWIALHVMAVANLGWLGAAGGVEAWLAAGAPAVGLASALVWELQGRSASQPALAGVITLLATALLATADGLWAAALVAAIAASSGVALTGMLERDSSAPPERVQWAAGAIPALAVLPVAAREIDGRWALTPLQVVVVTGVLLLGGAVLSLRHNPGLSAGAPWAAVVGAGAAAVAIGVALAAPDVAPLEATADELVVATFNLEGGFSPDGRYDPDAAARAIVDLAADVVALQDVPRGRIRDGATDLAVFLERRTGLEVYWAGDRDGRGSAVATRLEPAAVVDRSVPGVVRVIEALVGPHDGEFRVLAVDAVGAPVTTVDVGGTLLQVWGAEPRSVIAGSLDSPPTAEPVATLLNAGLFDVTLALDDINPLTWPADMATAQLDYVLISPDLRPAGARVVARSPSNHLPVVARIAVRAQ